MTQDIKNTALNTTNKSSLVILKHNKKFMFCILCVFIFVLLFGIFGVIMPVLNTRDYAAVWPTGHNDYATKIALFYINIIGLPTIPFIILLVLRRAGAYYFYNDRLEFKPFWLRRKKVISYNQMRILQQKTRIIILTQEIPPWTQPLQRFKVLFWNGVAFGTIFNDPKVAGVNIGITSAWENSANGPKALQILKKRALSVIEIDKI